MLTFFLGCVVHFIAAITVEKHDKAQMYGEEKTDWNRDTEVHNYPVVEHVEVGTEKVKHRPVGEELVN